MRSPVPYALGLGLLVAAGPAHALKQAEHYDLAVASCGAAGLPEEFCEHAGAADYDVDANEWNDLAAHAQTPVGADACAAADASVWRAFWLGGRMRAAAFALAAAPSSDGADALADDLGRVLHLVQDECAHSGMPNPQHAWHSLSDLCQGTTESPDVDPAAIDCAARASDAVFAALGDVLAGAGVSSAALDQASWASKAWPAHADVCAFLASASDWDGVDRRWDDGVVAPALLGQLALGLSGADAAQFQHVCRSADDVLPRRSDPLHDTVGGAQSCVGVHVYCLGKADDAAPSPPPWEPGAAPLDATSATVAPATGCDFGGAAPPPAAPALVAFALAFAALLRRRA